jgi:hypothetical protein
VQARFNDLTNYSGVPEVWVLRNQDVRSPLHYQKAYGRPGKAADHFAPLPWSSGKQSNYKGTSLVAANDAIDFVVDPMYTVFPGHSEHSDGNATDIIELSAVVTYVADGGLAN